MDFLIVENDQIVHLGPKPWNKYAFESCILDDMEVVATLPSTCTQLYVVSPSIKIYPVTMQPYPTMNTKIQHLAGPFYTFSPTSAVGYYNAVDKPIDIVKAELTNVVAYNRLKKEEAGTTAVIQNLTVTIDTSRSTRDVFALKYMMMGATDTVLWKFPEGWLTLSKTDLGLAVQAGVTYIQTQFTWESQTAASIAACTTLAQLDAIGLV